MKKRDFTYIGKEIPKIDEYKNSDFLLNLQKAMILTLEGKKLLTTSQAERCIQEIEHQYITKQKHKNT